MKLPIVAYGDPVLKKVADNIEQSYPDLKALIANMFETMYHGAAELVQITLQPGH